jgi:hypothetical protein
MLSIGLTLREIRAIFAPHEPIRACPTDTDLRVSMRRAEPIYRHHIEAIDATMTDLVGCRRALEMRLERCRLEIEASGVVELPEPFSTKRQMRPGRVVYEPLSTERNELLPPHAERTLPRGCDKGL